MNRRECFERVRFRTSFRILCLLDIRYKVCRRHKIKIKKFFFFVHWHETKINKSELIPTYNIAGYQNVDPGMQCRDNISTE